MPEDVPQELRRRIAKLGTYYIDLPTEAERSMIWDIHRAVHEIPAGARQNSHA